MIEHYILLFVYMFTTIIISSVVAGYIAISLGGYIICKMKEIENKADMKEVINEWRQQRKS